MSGFNCKDYKYEEFLRYLIEKIKHITYEKGQVNVSVVNFSITLLPIFKDFVKKVDLDMLDIKNKNKKIK